jgi:hypothetical protein
MQLKESKTNSHFYISLLKSVVRIIAGVYLILGNIVVAGSALIAAEVLGRNWIGIELSENYAEVARKRVQSFIDKKKQMELEFQESL